MQAKATSATPSWLKSLPSWQKVVGAIILVLLLGLIGLAAMPWGIVAGRFAGPIGRAIGRPVSIGDADRVDHFSLHPRLALNDVTIGQPAAFGPRALARIRRVELRFRVLPLLLGRFRPENLVIDGADLRLIRTAAGVANWTAGKPAPDDDSEDGGLSLAALTVRNSHVRLVDRQRHIALAGALSADRAAGISFDATGTHRDTPLTARLRLAGTAAAPTTPLRSVDILVRSPLARLRALATLDDALDFAHFRATLRAGGTDLRYLDDFIQAGLFPTRPFSLTAIVRHDPRRWQISRIGGDIGDSRLVAALLVTRQEGRTRLTGRVDADRLDFDDFSSSEDRAKAATLRRAIGPRVIPATRIRLDKLGQLDGTVTLDAKRLVGSPTFRTLQTTVTLDHRRLIARPLLAGLRSGTLAGQAVIDHRGRAPRLSLDVRLRGARIERLLLPGGAIEGPITGRLRLAGTGPTMRAALTKGSGQIDLLMRSGSVRRDFAIFAGGDVLRTIGTLIGGDRQARTPVRCLAGTLPVRSGVATVRRLVLDTPITRADGTGRILLANEHIDLSLSARAHHSGPLVSTAPVRVGGTLSDPKLDIRPPRAEEKGKGGVFERIGFFIKGLKTKREAQPDGPPPPIDC